MNIYYGNAVIERLNSFIEVVASNNLWFDIDANNIYSNEQLLLMLENNEYELNEISNNPSVMPIIGNIPFAIVYWVPRFEIRLRQHIMLENEYKLDKTIYKDLLRKYGGMPKPRTYSVFFMPLISMAYLLVVGEFISENLMEQQVILRLLPGITDNLYKLMVDLCIHEILLNWKKRLHDAYKNDIYPRNDAGHIAGDLQTTFLEDAKISYVYLMENWQHEYNNLIGADSNNEVSILSILEVLINLYYEKEQVPVIVQPKPKLTAGRPLRSRNILQQLRSRK